MSRKKRIARTQEFAEGEWRRADLHLHTPASADWQEPGVSYLQWLQKAESKGLDIIAITDHNTVEGIAQLRTEIERLTWLEANQRLRPQERRDLDEYRRLGEKLLVLPGFEFTATFGFHILAIFSPDTPLRTLELLLLRLNVPVQKLTEGSTEVGVTSDVLTAYRLINEAGGLVIAAHANSAHGVAMHGLTFGGQTKIAYTQDPNLHALEVTDLESSSRRSTAHFFDGSKPEYPRRMHCIQGSDAHRLTRDPKDKNRLGIGERVTEILMPEVSFEALRAVLTGDDFTRTRPYRPMAEEPFDHVEAARQAGNTIIQAFHESMTQQGGRLHKVLCDVTAFANTQGGTIYIGVSAARKGAPRGVENALEAVAVLKKEIERKITPPLEVRVDVLQSAGVPVVRVIVPNGSDKPYALEQTRIYVRQEAETVEAVRDEIVQLVLGQRRPVAQPPASAPAPRPVEPQKKVEAPKKAAPPAAKKPEAPAAPKAPEKPIEIAPSAAEAERPAPAEIPTLAEMPAKIEAPIEVVPLVEAPAVVEMPMEMPTEIELPVAEMPEVAEGQVKPEVSVVSEIAGEPVAVLVPEIGNAPTIGVEILSMEERKGVRYFSIRDLRNGNVVHNVTPASARKLWSYALNQAAARPVDPDKVTWSGEYGLWQVARRAKKWRYDLVLRRPDGGLRVFYGVTADGMTGPWTQFLKEEDRAE